MFPTFSGSARRPRQVNLSGRNSNPFAVQQAQQQRIARQQERERIQAATLVQSRWRGNAVRRSIKEEQRHHWDQVEGESSLESDEPYHTDTDALSQLSLLTRFIDLEDEDDLRRLERLQQRLQLSGKAQNDVLIEGGPWPAAYLRLQNVCLTSLARPLSDHDTSSILAMLVQIINFIPQATSGNAEKFYSCFPISALRDRQHDALLTMPLRPICSTTLSAYASFANHVLSDENLLSRCDETGLQQIMEMINCKVLGKAVHQLLNTGGEYWKQHGPESRLALLCTTIYCYRHAHDFQDFARYGADPDFVSLVSSLLSSLVEYIQISGLLGVAHRSHRKNALSDEIEHRISSANRSSKTLDFYKTQLESLISQENISNLLVQASPLRDIESSPVENTSPGDQTRLLANYILTLLRLFPSRGDDIRMWLYLSLNGSPYAGKSNAPAQHDLAFFWNAITASQIFRDIQRDSKAAVPLLKVRNPSTGDEPSVQGVEDQWRVILMFVEIYSFVLKIMDDEEFFGRKREQSPLQAGQGRKNLQLHDVAQLVTFLKNLGFAMYYNAPDILGNSEDREVQDVSAFFRAPSSQSNGIADPEKKSLTQEKHVAGIAGLTLEYMKGLVTGLLRSLYERDSRRPFLPEGHWLMTSRFEMTSMFIDMVVEEEEKRHQVEEQTGETNDGDGSDGEADLPSEDEVTHRELQLVGTRRERSIHQQRAKLQRQQRKAHRKRILQAVAPRLEILQNMPFLIPFTTRVKIFRRFVHRDQMIRRNGIQDAETWRLIQESHGPIQRHQANIRRDHEFEDAYEEFYNLGDGLKEPIQITFVDRFGQAEAGIDGGGVTKEFLTSVTNQAFSNPHGISLFIENDQHYLFPNPSAIAEQMALLDEAGFSAKDAETRDVIGDLLRRYEFLGRVVGKCLYEGILIDVSFAGFFLLKWALTGGTGSAPGESGYRANLNDLRDFDKELYQGLLQLKNYTGDVERDFSLNFTVTDTLRLPGHTLQDPPRVLTSTGALKPNGADESVTNANRLVYISLIARHRLSRQPAKQTAAFLRGLSAIIQPSWLSMFNQSELQTLIGGAAQQISIPDLRRNTIYGGLYVIGDDHQEHPTVQMFWEVMAEISEDDKGKVLKFVTSTPRAPLLGFASLLPRFSIRDGGTDEARLPSTSTCVNLLKLPRYTRKAVLREKLLHAVSSGAGFDLS